MASPDEVQALVTALDKMPDPPPGPNPVKEMAIKAESALAHEIESTVEGTTLGNLPELPADRKNDRARIKRFIDQIENTDLERAPKELIIRHVTTLLRRLGRLDQI